MTEVPDEEEEEKMLPTDRQKITPTTSYIALIMSHVTGSLWKALFTLDC